MLKIFILILSLILSPVTAAGQPYPAPLTHGPVVGAVTSTTASVFIRTGTAVTGAVRLTDPQGNIVDTAFNTDNTNDYTKIITAYGLTPATCYTVTVNTSQNQQVSSWPAPTKFTTFPSSNSTDPITIVYLTDFQGINDYPKEPSPVFAKAMAEQPNFVVIGGDFDHSDPALPKSYPVQVIIDSYRTMWKNLYDPLKLVSFVPTVLNNTSVVHMLDDHDYGSNNQDKDFHARPQAYQVFKEFMPTYQLPPTNTYGLWQNFSYAYVDIFLADTRTQRTNEKSADNSVKSMLDGNHIGPNGQLQRFKNWLSSSTAIWKLVVMPTPFNPTIIKKSSLPIYQQDSWTGYQTERNIIMSYIRSNNIKNIVMLSGDLHAGGIDDGTNSGVIEMLSPAVNFTTASPEKCLSADFIGKWSHGVYVNTKPKICNGYGVISITPSTISLAVKDENGNAIIQFSTTAQ